MKLELNSASDFLMNLLRLKKVDPLLDNTQLQNFKGSLESLLAVHYRSHWYPDLPNKGSGYRCIRINGKMDPLIVQAGIAVGLKPSTLSKMLPAELTLWIDPEEVAYRIGENGSICVLYESNCRSSPSSDLDSTGSPASNSSDEFIMDRVGRPDQSEFIDRSSSSVSPPHSANSSPTKPTTMPPMHNGYYQQMQPPHLQQPPIQNHQYHRQNFNANHIHQQPPPPPQHQYQQVPHWDAFNNSNKVLCG